MNQLPKIIEAKFMPEPNTGCWIWMACLTKGGYGKFSTWHNRKTHVAHKLIYELLIGPVPKGLELDHLCRNRFCVNPEHLEPVTHRVNILRGKNIVAYNSTKISCLKGHPLSGSNLKINHNGHRMCRLCWNMHQRRMYHARKEKIS